MKKVFFFIIFFLFILLLNYLTLNAEVVEQEGRIWVRYQEKQELNEFSRVVDMSVLENTKWPKNGILYIYYHHYSRRFDTIWLHFETILQPYLHRNRWSHCRHKHEPQEINLELGLESASLLNFF